MVSIKVKMWCKIWDTYCFKCMFWNDGRCPYLEIRGDVRKKAEYWCVQCKTKVVDARKHLKMYPQHVLVELKEEKK